MEKFPLWASRSLKASDLELVRKAVHAAESRTTGEFVVCVVRRSTGTALVSTLVSLLLFAGLVMHSVFSQGLGYYGNPLLAWLMAALISAVLGHFLGQVGFVQRLFAPKHERQLHVQRRARLEFHQNNLEKTKGATGVLLFVSLMERQAVVLADKSIAAKVGPQVWQGVLDKILQGVKRGQLGEGLHAALELSADIVAPKFPRKAKKKNELSDRLIVKE